MSRSVELVRVEPEERVFDRERVLGRDTTSVFPSLANANDDDDSTHAPSTSGAPPKLVSKFVTESELHELRQRGIDEAAKDAHNGSSYKPLFQVLAEAKERKELEFADQWTEMKIGKNRPLDAEEFEFLSKVEDEQRDIELKRKREEMSELEVFRKTQQASEGVRMSDEGKTAPEPAPACVVARRAKPKVAIKPKAPEPTPEAVDDDDKTNSDAGGGLGGLLGDYGSDSDD